MKSGDYKGKGLKVFCHLIYWEAEVLCYLSGCRDKMGCQVLKGNQ